MFECRYCKRKYSTKKESIDCFEEHRIVYVPIALSDLNGLLHFLYDPKPEYLNPNMVKIIKEYISNNAKKS